MIVSIQKAIQLTGKSRSTIERHIKNGKLSRSGEGIDTSELLRAYGAFVKNTDTPIDASLDNYMTHREKWLMQQIEDLKREYQSREQQYIQREQRLMSLLTHQEDVSSKDNKPITVENNLWRKIFKAAK